MQYFYEIRQIHNQANVALNFWYRSFVVPLRALGKNEVTDGQTIDNEPNCHQYSHGHFRVCNTFFYPKQLSQIWSLHSLTIHSSIHGKKKDIGAGFSSNDATCF